MANIKLFENASFGPVRVVMINDDPWFVAADVCKCLDLSNPSQILTYLDDDEKQLLTGEQFSETQSLCTLTINKGAPNADSGVSLTCYPSGVNIISESGLYSLVTRSRKPEANTFRRWVTHDVLPSIRKTGMYAPRTYLEALKALVAEVEAKEKAQAALLQEQTAHALAKQQLNQLAVMNQQLLVQQGLAGEYRTVKSLSWWNKITTPGLPTGRKGNNVFWSPLGKALTALCQRAGGLYVPYDRRASTWGEFQARRPWDIMRIADPDFDVLNVYPLCAIDAFKQALMSGTYDNYAFTKYLRPEYKEILASVGRV